MADNNSKNLGLVKLYHTGSEEPTNKAQIWLQSTVDGLVQFAFNNITETWEPMGGSGGGSTSAAVFVTNVQVAAGKFVEKTYVEEVIGADIIASIYTDTRNLTVFVEWDGSTEHWNGSVTVNGEPITNGQRIGETRRFAGSVDIVVTESNEIVVRHSSGTKLDIPVEMAAEAPEVLTLNFTGVYPSGQTELKAGDTFQIAGTTNSAASKIEIADFGAFSGAMVNVSGTAFTITGTVANRGVTAQDLKARVRAYNSFNSYGSWKETSGTVKLNNVYPTLAYGVITYPAGQGALKDAEGATVAFTSANADTVQFTSPELALTGATSLTSPLQVNRSSGDYNISLNNLTASLKRNANGAVATFSTVVKIAHVAPVISIVNPAARLRSGGNAGTGAQSHIITLSSNQVLYEIPSIAGNLGTLQGTMANASGMTVFTQSLAVHDNDAKGAGTWQLVSAKNLAGKVVSGANHGAYVVGGFVFRTLTVAALQREVAIGTMVTDTSKLRCTNLSKGSTGSLNYSFAANVTDAVDKYTVTSPAGTYNANGVNWRNLDGANADSNASGTMKIELEEII